LRTYAEDNNGTLIDPNEEDADVDQTIELAEFESGDGDSAVVSVSGVADPTVLRRASTEREGALLVTESYANICNEGPE
jgi:hypothetical protein